MTSLMGHFLHRNVLQLSFADDKRQCRVNISANIIYFTILIIALVVLGLTWSLNETVTTMEIKNPTMLYFQENPGNSNCSCTQSKIPNSGIISIGTVMHPICASDFVTDRWINAIQSGSNSTHFHLLDFRTYGSEQFQALATFCNLARNFIDNKIRAYQNDFFISWQVFIEMHFDMLLMASIQQLQSTIQNEFSTQLNLVLGMSTGNRLISGLQTNNIQIYEMMTNGQIKIDLYPGQYLTENGFICDCSIDPYCEAISGIFDIFNAPTSFNPGNNSILLRVPGMSSGCLPINSLFSSTLQCFYNQTCINQLISFFPTKETFTALNESNFAVFSPSTSVEIIINQAMVEEMNITSSYVQYYSLCAPVCSYSKLEERNMLFVVTKLFGILGGLAVILGLIMSIPLYFIQRPRNVIQIIETVSNEPSIPVKKSLYNTIIDLNYFQHQLSNDRQLRYQRNATRLYIFLVVGLLIPVIIYTLPNNQTFSITIMAPTLHLYEKLRLIYPDTLSCPCTDKLTSYSSFVMLRPEYHQVCTSAFISPEWINYLSMNADSTTILFSGDYRRIAVTLFQSLSMFCQVAMQTVDNDVNTFLHTDYISSQVASSQLLESQIDVQIAKWQLTIVNQFLRTLTLIKAVTYGNHLMNDFNFNYYTNSTTRKTIIKPMMYSNCSCALSPSCLAPMAIYQYNRNLDNMSEVYRIPNFFLGCYPIESLLASTLECFYNQSCMMEIDRCMIQPLGNAFAFPPLNKSINDLTESIESIINRLMISSWSIEVSYTEYYAACAPQYCTYSYMGGRNYFVTITTIITAFGGLIFGLYLLVWIVLHSMEYIFVIHITCINIINTIKNVFNYRDEQCMVRLLYFIFMLASLPVLYIRTSFNSNITTIKIENPSLKTYGALFRYYPESLQCTCSNIAIPYEAVLSVTPRFHQVCSSAFVTDQWIVYLYGKNSFADRYITTDFLNSAMGQFQLLSSLCNLSQKTVQASFQNMYTHNMISIELLPESLFYIFVRSNLYKFINDTSRLFLYTLDLIRGTTGANKIMTTLSTSWIIDTPSVIVNQSKAYTTPQVYQGCSCAAWSYQCGQPSRNMYAACYPLEALLQSTLECLYNQQCIDPTNTFQAISISSASRFALNTTIAMILNELMVEEYSSVLSYASYFAQCAPKSCTYSGIEQINIKEKIINFISLYGSLTIICRLIAVVIIKLCRCRCRTQRADPIVHQ